MNKYIFHKTGYSVKDNRPFLYYEGPFGRVDIFLSRPMDWQPVMGPNLETRVNIPFYDVYLNSEKIYPKCVHLEKGILVIE